MFPASIGLGENRLIADGVDANLIAGGIQAQVLERKYRRHPSGAADVGDTEAFAAQIFCFFDLWPHDDIVRKFVARTGDDFQILSAGDRRKHRRTAAAAKLYFAAGHGGHLQVAAAQINRLDVEAIFGKEPSTLSDP